MRGNLERALGLARQVRKSSGVKFVLAAILLIEVPFLHNLKLLTGIHDIGH
jgi:hypothetical protein